MHVDLVRNDWDLRLQIPVGRVVVVGDDLVPKDVVSDFDDVVQQAIARINPVQPIEDRLRDLTLAVQGTVLFFTDAHEDEACAFLDCSAVPMTVRPFTGLPG